MRTIISIVILIAIGAVIWFFFGVEPAEAPPEETENELPADTTPPSDEPDIEAQEEEESSLPPNTDVGMEYPIPDDEILLVE